MTMHFLITIAVAILAFKLKGHQGVSVFNLRSGKACKQRNNAGLALLVKPLASVALDQHDRLQLGRGWVGRRHWVKGR